MTLALAVASLAGTAYAADTSVDPRIEIGALHNTNLRLGTGPFKREVSGGYLDALAVFRTATQTTEASLTPRIRANKYTQNSDEETTDWFLTGAVTHRGETSRMGLTASISEQDVVNTVLLPSGGGVLGQPGVGGSDISLEKNKARVITAAPDAQFRTGPRTSIDFSADYQDIAYDRNINGGQYDYSNFNGALGFGIQATERVRVTTSATIGLFNPDGGARSADSYGARIEAWREQTERLRAFVRVGASRSKIDAAGTLPEESFTNVLVGAGIERRYELSQLLLQANRSLDGNGSGDLQLRNEIYLQWTRQLGPRSGLELGGRAVFLETVDERSSYPDRDYYVASGQYDYRIRRTVSLFGRYEYSSQKYSGFSDSPTSHAFYLGVVMEPHRRD